MSKTDEEEEDEVEKKLSVSIFNGSPVISPSSSSSSSCIIPRSRSSMTLRGQDEDDEKKERTSEPACPSSCSPAPCVNLMQPYRGGGGRKMSKSVYVVNIHKNSYRWKSSRHDVGGGERKRDTKRRR